MATSSDLDGSIWRQRALLTLARGLEMSRTVADKGALLREMARLSDNHIELPWRQIGLNETDLHRLRRFDLYASVSGGHLPRLQLELRPGYERRPAIPA